MSLVRKVLVIVSMLLTGTSILSGGMVSAEIEIEGSVGYFFNVVSDSTTTNNPEEEVKYDVLDPGTLGVELSGDYARGYGISMIQFMSELRMSSSWEAEGGWTYGGRIDIRPGKDFHTDEAYIHIGSVKGGELKIGHTPHDGYGYVGKVGFEGIVVGGLGQDGQNYIGGSYASPGGGDGNRVVYTSPELSGIRMGLSWAFSADEDFEETNTKYKNSVEDIDTHKEGVIAIGLSYSGEIGSIGYKLGGGFVEGSNVTGVPFGSVKIGDKVGKFTGSRIGIELESRGLSVAYGLPFAMEDVIEYRLDKGIDEDNKLVWSSGTLERRTVGFDLGMAYNFGIGGISSSLVQHVDLDYRDNTSKENDNLDIGDTNSTGSAADKKLETKKTSFAIDGEYNIVSGLELVGEFMMLWTEYENHNAHKDNPANELKYQVLVGLRVNF